jgi:hypothetical protein
MGKTICKSILTVLILAAAILFLPYTVVTVKSLRYTGLGWLILLYIPVITYVISALLLFLSMFLANKKTMFVALSVFVMSIERLLFNDRTFFVSYLYHCFDWKHLVCLEKRKAAQN